MARPDFENLRIYRLAEQLANLVWQLVKPWDAFAKDTLGKQLVRSADSVCANIAEGRGRYNYRDHARFIKIARGSLYETISWLRLAYVRRLIPTDLSTRIQITLNDLTPQLNAYLKSLKR